MQVSQTLVNQVMQELRMTQEDIKKFTQPNSIHKKYRRAILYNMSKYQLNLFSIIAIFPDGVVNVKDRQNHHYCISFEYLFA